MMKITHDMRKMKNQVMEKPPAPAPSSVPAMNISNPAWLMLDTSVGRQVADDFLSGKLCVGCLKPCDTFFAIVGSTDFYRRTLAALGCDPLVAIRVAQLHQGRIRRTPVCRDCAARAGLGVPTSWTDMMLMSPEDKLAPAAMIAENAQIAEQALAELQAKDKRLAKAQARKEEHMARIAGLQKDMADVVAALEARGYLQEMGGKHVKILTPEGEVTTADGTPAVFPAGQVVTSVSISPHNAGRTLKNIYAAVARWERAHLPEKEETVRRYTLAEKAALVSRYDNAPRKKDFLEQEKLTRDAVYRWRKELQEHNWPVPLPEEEGLTRLCLHCGKDKPQTEKFFAQEKMKSGRVFWSDQCLACQQGDAIPPVAANPDGTIRDGHRVEAAAGAVITPDDPPRLDEDEAVLIARLMGRKRFISRRLEEIEKLLVPMQDLITERERLSAERDKVESELLDAVTAG